VFAFRRLLLRRRVIVNLKTEKAFRGVITRKAGALVELADVELLEAGKPPVRLDGRVVLERSSIDFVQVTGEG
jgi:hypothetical protein